MDKDAADILAALKAEANRVAYRKSLLLKVEALWAEDPQFRALIRGLVKTSSIKDKRGNKSSIDTKLAKSAIELGTSLGLTKNKILLKPARHAPNQTIRQLINNL